MNNNEISNSKSKPSSSSSPIVSGNSSNNNKQRLFSPPSRSSSMTMTTTRKSNKSKKSSSLLTVFIGGIILGGCLMYNFKTLFDLTTSTTIVVNNNDGGQQQISYNNKEYDIDMPQQQLTETESSSSTVTTERKLPTTSTTTRTTTIIPTTAQEIIDDAYSNTYQDLVEYCGPGNNKVDDQKEDHLKEYYSKYLPSQWFDWKPCLEDLYSKGYTNSTLNQKWPWWFMTLLRDSINPGHIFGGWHWIVPHPNMGICMYEKGGSKQWRQLSCQIHINNTSTIVHESECRKAGRAWNPPNSDVSKIVFIRDPLDRFLSGFLDKCVDFHSNPLNEQHCEPSIIFQGDGKEIKALTEDFKTKDPKRLFETYVETFPLQWNIHFVPLSFQCGGLYNSLPYYDFVGLMGSNFYHEIQRLVDKFPHIQPAAELVFKISEKTKTKNKEEATADKKPIVKNVGVERQAAAKVLQYYSPKTLRKVLQYVSIDYKLLGIPIPEWAENMLLNDVVDGA